MRRAGLELSREQLRHISDRHFGVGCDQILQVEKPHQPGTDFYYRIFNADGGEVGQCGNGARCFVRYVREHDFTGKSEIRVGTLGGVIVPRLEADGQITVDVGVPEFDSSRIPFQAERRAGETLACGTGARAAVATGIHHGLLDRRMTVTTRGGDLSILWEVKASRY